MSFPGSLYQSNWAPPYQTQAQMSTPSFNPAVPPFQQNGMSLQRNDAPFNVQTSETAKLQKYIYDMELIHEHDMNRLVNQVQDHEQKMKDMESKNVASWQQQQFQIVRMEEETDDVDGVIPLPFRRIHYFDADASARESCAPTEWMLQRYSKVRLGEMYISGARYHGTIADNMKKQAEEMLGGQIQKLTIEAPPTPGDKVIGFACCEMAYGSVKDLLEHVEKTHAAQMTISKREVDEAADIPAPAAASQAQPKPHSNAIEIKDPEEALKLDQGQGETDNVEIAPQMSLEPERATPAVNATWAPYAVTQMSPFQGTIPPNHTQIFSFDLITNNFKGNEWSPSFHFIPSSVKDAILPSRSYWLLNSTEDPYLPTQPGQHGAKLTAFFNETFTKPGDAPNENNYVKVPVFIREPGSTQYRYYGDYTQTRYSDKVSYDTLKSHIPPFVLKHRADQLASPGRPEWVTESLMNHFWPKPTYPGLSPTDSALNSPASSASYGSGSDKRVQQALSAYAEELKIWEKDTRLKVNLLTSAAILDSFSKPDSDIEPGMRLWWEYLECVGYDERFYRMLVGFKEIEEGSGAGSKGKIGSRRPPSVVYEDGSTAVKKGEKDLDVAEKKNAELLQAAEDLLKPTEFVTVDFDFDNPPPPLAMEPKKQPDNSKAKKTVQPAVATSWDGFGDMNAAKGFSAEVVHSEKNVCRGSGKGRDMGGSLPPHKRMGHK